MNQLDSYINAYNEHHHFAFDNNIILNWYPERIIQLCPMGGRLLELGIGHGYTTERLSRHFSNHIVIDGSESIIEQFKQQHPDCTASVKLSYFEDFETEERFDVIVMGFILEHVSNPHEILDKFKKLLSPGGKCFITVPNGESLHRRIGNAAGLLDNMMTLGSADLEFGHERMYSVDTLAHELLAAGYQIVRKEGIFLKALTTVQLKQLNLTQDIIAGMCKVGIDYPELCAALLLEVKAE